MRRGDIWLAEVGGKPRPVLVITRNDVIDVRLNVTVVEVTTQVRGLTVEVPVLETDAGITHASVVNCDGIHTIAQRRLTKRLGAVDDETLAAVCGAVAYGLGCEVA